MKVVGAIVVGSLALLLLGNSPTHLPAKNALSSNQQPKQTSQPASITPEKLVVSEEINWYETFTRYAAPALIILLGTILGVAFTRRNAVSDHWLKTNSHEIEAIERQLDKFWGPYLLLSNANHLFAQDIRSRQPCPNMYRMLPSLFDPDWCASLSDGDRMLLKDVGFAGEKLTALIVENAGMVEARLLPFLARAIAHWRVLRLAAEGQLGTDQERFLRYIYPKVLDEAVYREVIRLHRRLTLLRSAPSKNHGPMPPLDLAKLKLDDWPDPSRPKYVEGEGLVDDAEKSQSLFDKLWYSLQEPDAGGANKLSVAQATIDVRDALSFWLIALGDQTRRAMNRKPSETRTEQP